LTPRLLAANRRNAKKSTGPRTRAGKARSRWSALKHGRYLQPHAETLRHLDEDPREYAHLLRETLQSYPPANPLQRMLVEDVARLRWERLRIQRAKEAKLAKRLQEWEHEQRRGLAELDQESSNISQAEVLESGLRRAKDSPAKFRELMQFLEVLEGIVARGDLTRENRELLFGIWGKNPTMRGAQIISLFERFRKRGGAPVEDNVEMSGEEEASTPRDAEAGGEAETEGQENAGEDWAEREERGVYAGLKMALAEEFRDVVEEYQLYLAEHADRSRTARDACLAPCEDGEWSLLLRWESLIDREMERKIKLYLLMRRRARRTKGEEIKRKN
jgi:hypothetical protein